MGLESRTDYQGKILSAGLLAAMHAGSVYGVKNLGVGGQATNTLILLHIFAGGKKAVGFSIPRDDWVTFPKAYDGQSAGQDRPGLRPRLRAVASSATVNSDRAIDQRYLQANQAGQAATIATVQAVTGQKIDHFAEVNLAGFYYLAQAFGGIEVCVKPWQRRRRTSTTPTPASTRSRHGGLTSTCTARRRRWRSSGSGTTCPNGDLDRTHRQQAVLDYVIWKLEHNGVLSDLGQLNSLLNTAKQYLITDSDWDLLDFRHRDARPDGEEPPVLHGADRRVRRRSTARPPTRSTSRRSRRHQAEVHRPGARGEVDKHGEVRAKAAPRSRPRRPSPSTSTTAGARRAWPPASRRRWSPRATRAAPSPDASAQSHRSRRAPRCSTARARRPTRRRSRATSARPPSAHVAARRPRRGAARHRRHRRARRPRLVGRRGAGAPRHGDLGREQRRGRRRGHGGREGEVRHPLRVLGDAARGASIRTRDTSYPEGNQPVASRLGRGGTGMGRHVRVEADRGQGRLCGELPARGGAARGGRLRLQGGRPGQRRARASRINTGGPQVGAMNILVMGLESRTDYEGADAAEEPA